MNSGCAESSGFMDILPCGKFMLAAYPNYLLLGTATVNSNKVILLSCKSVKIYCQSYPQWIQLFSSFARKCLPSEGQIENCFTENDYNWTIVNNSLCIKSLDKTLLVLEYNECTILLSHFSNFRFLLVSYAYSPDTCLCLQETFNYFREDQDYVNKLKNASKLTILQVIRDVCQDYNIVFNSAVLLNSFLRLRPFILHVHKCVEQFRLTQK